MVEQIPMKKKTVRYAQQQNQEEKGLEEEKKSSERTFRRKCPGKKTGEFYTAILRPISNRASQSPSPCRCSILWRLAKSSPAELRPRWVSDCDSDRHDKRAGASKLQSATFQR